MDRCKWCNEEFVPTSFHGVTLINGRAHIATRPYGGRLTKDVEPAVINQDDLDEADFDFGARGIDIESDETTEGTQAIDRPTAQPTDSRKRQGRRGHRGGKGRNVASKEFNVMDIVRERVAKSEAKKAAKEKI